MIQISNEKNKSKERAIEILNYTAEYLSNNFKEIQSLILVGSLSNNSYIEGKGRDIDLITVLYDGVSLSIKNKIFDDIKEIENKFNDDIPIAKTIYYLSEMLRPFRTDFPLSLENKHLLEITVELQRIHESGDLLYGNDIKSILPIPTREEYILFDKLGIEFNKRSLDDDPILKKSCNC